MTNNDTAPILAQAEIRETPTEQKIRLLVDERRRITEHIGWLKAHQDILDQIGVVPSRFQDDSIDFNNPNRKQIVEIIKAFPGMWDKNLNDWDKNKMDYVKRSEDGERLQMRIWSGELPPCCKIVEEWVDVPAQPATRVLKRIVKCPEPLPQAEPEMEAAQ